MREDWKLAHLGDICDFQNGFAFKSKLFREFGTPVLRIKNIQKEKVNQNNLAFVNPTDYQEDLSKYKVVNGDLLIAMSGATTGKIGINQTDCEYLLNQRVGKFIPHNQLSTQFLYYYLLAKVEDNLAISAGSAQPNLSTNQIKNFEIFLPPLPEQKRIVAILDEAFAAISTAMANVERNLVNAQALIAISLRDLLSRATNDWISTTIGEQIQLQRGFDITKKQQEPGNVPVVSSGGIKSFHSEAKVLGPGVVIGRKGSIGSVYYINENFWPHDTTLWVKEFNGNNPRFVYYFFTIMDLVRFDSGTANPALNRNILHPLPVTWPPKYFQEKLARRGDDLSSKIENLAHLYQQKHTLLIELKQSILHKAFTGELTADTKAAERTLMAAGL